MKIMAGLLIKKGFTRFEDIQKYQKDIETYIYHVDLLVIYNMSGTDLAGFLTGLKKYSYVELAECQDFGEVYNYQLVLNKGIEVNADYVVVLEQDYYYEPDSFLEMKRFLLTEKESPSILTPMPLFTCLEHKQNETSFREIKGAHLVGALINIGYYKESNGFVEEYYQTMFDYDYGLSERLKGRKIILLNNAILRNRNYQVIEKRFLFLKRTGFDRDLINLYYETRNRYYLWDKYQQLDPEFVKLDKKLFKQEKRDMKFTDVNYQDKVTMMEKAKADYQNNIMGKTIE